MTTELVLAPDTELDLVEAYAWYEDLRPGLGAEFLGCVDACIETIVRRPQLYGEVHESYRRALVRRFPYGSSMNIPEAWRQYTECYTPPAIQPNGVGGSLKPLVETAIERL